VLVVYRRHVKQCPHRSRRERRCRCPLHAEGTLRGERIRRALDLTSWEAGQDRIRNWELGVTANLPITLAEAAKTFLEDAAARKLSRESLKQYRGLLKQLGSYAERHGFRYLKQLDLAALRQFRNQWSDGAISAKKRLERLRSFFRFAVHSSWLKRNAVASMRPPKTNHPPTMPFSREEIEKVLSACDRYPDNGRFRKGTPARLKALALLMRYSGLRIGDAVTLRTDRVVESKLFLYTQKTNVPVLCPLPDIVIDALSALVPITERYYFWSGDSDTRSITGNWQRRFQKLFKLAVVNDAHPHRFRDTFSDELLLAGVPIEDVSILLGHSSVKITERADAPWVQARQQRLESAVRKAW